MTADQSGGEYKSLIAPIRWSNSESLRISNSRRRKTAQQRDKNNKHSILRRTRTKIPMLVGDTPSPEMTAQRSKKYRLTPK